MLPIEECPLTFLASLLGSPDEAVSLLVKVSPIDILVAPIDFEVILQTRHSLGQAGAVAVELRAVADDVVLLACLYLAHVGNPDIGGYAFNLVYLPAPRVAVGGSVARIVIVAHVLLGKTVIWAVAAQVALHMGRMAVVAARHKEAACAVVQVGERIAHGSSGEEHVIVVVVLHAKVFLPDLVLERPLVVAHLLGNPLEAFLFFIEVAPIDKEDAFRRFVPADGVFVQLVGHALWLASGVARELRAVADEEIRLAVLKVVGIIHTFVAINETLSAETCAAQHHCCKEKQQKRVHLSHDSD